MDDETIMAAVFALMPTVTWTRADATVHQFVTMSRRVKIFSDVSSSLQPACFQAEWATQEAQRTNLPYRTILEANWIVFQCVAVDPTAAGSIENNLILKAIRTAFAPQPSDPGFLDKRNTLGRLVYHCYIGGKIFKDPGDLDNQGMMTIPIRVLVP